MTLSDAASIVYAGIPGFMPQQYPPDYRLGPIEAKCGVGYDLNTAIKSNEPPEIEDVCGLCGENLPEHAHAAITRDGEFLAVCGHCKEVFDL
jgi:hypothetical protein